MKLPLPEKFGGEDNWDKFGKWYLALLNYYFTHGLAGEKNNVVQVSSMGVFLTGGVLSWLYK